MRIKTLVLAALSVGVLTTSLSATTIGLWSTGVCAGANTTLSACQGAAGSLLNYGSSVTSVFDNNYKLTSRIDGGTTGTNSASTEHAISTYVADNVGASEWIGPSPLVGTENIGAYTYRTTFDLTGFIASTLVLSLDVAADNSVQVKINGNDVSSLFNFANTGSASCGTSSAAAHLWCFEAFSSNHSITSAQAGGFLAGLNTIDFVVTNADGPSSPTGLRVQAQGNATLSAVPEPVSSALVGLGLAGFAFFRRKRS